MDSLNSQKKIIIELKELLVSHRLFANKLSIEHVRIFMESHVFSVWGFMSLLKSLQIGITSNHIPWRPNENTKNGLTNFVNEIVLCEESDYLDGIGYISHFEIYLLAMENIKSNSENIVKLIKKLQKEKYNKELINALSIHNEVKDFINFDLEVSLSKSLPKIVGSFTLGREKVIPSMFSYIISCIEEDANTKHLLTYLKRHISIDGDRHGPLSLKLLDTICKNENDYCIAYSSGIKSLELRLKVWDKISSELGIDNI